MAERALKQKAVLSAEDRQFNRNKWLFGISGIGRDMSYQLIASFLLAYVQFGTTLTVAQFTTISLLIGVAGRIWDAINDPMMGAIIEGTHMKFGKFRPWIMIGAVLTGVVIIAMFNVQSLSSWSFVAFMVVMYLLWETAFTMNDIGYWSMLASLSSTQKQRDQATMLTVVFAGIGGFVAQGIIPMIYPGHVREAFRWLSIGIAAIFVAMQVVMAIFIKERPRAQMEVNEKISLKQMWDTIRHNDQVLWMTLSMLFYNVGSSMLVGFAYNLYYLEIGYDGNAIVFVAIFGVFNILAQLLYPVIVKKMGRRKLQIMSIALACVGYAGIALLGWAPWFPFELYTLSIFGAFVFVGQALFYMSSIINMTNCVEYNEYKRGERNEAVVSTLRPFMAKFAEALKYGIVTLVLVVSTVYGLSQNISTLESQRSYFNADAMTTEQQIDYIDSVNSLRVEWNNATSEQQADKEFIDGFTNKIDEYELTKSDGTVTKPLAGHQISSEYLNAIGDIAVMKVIRNDKNEVTDTVFVALVKDIEAGKASETLVAEDKTSYEFTISYSQPDNTEYNAANINFRDNRTTSMRVWLRMGVTVVPIICISIALLIQHKKFFITEEYYDMMLDEINNRKQLNGDGEQNVGKAEADGNPSNNDVSNG